ncbi:MAG: hypothetical protein EHM41_11255 [Chloroflexi bacterium]|nr:MAG: hypothetical protein EHM41_11255 [Chloroflexota bacterium]
MKTRKSSPAFEKYVQETIDEGVTYLSSQGWLDEKTGGPDVAKIPGLEEPQHVRLPVEVVVAISRTLWNAPAHEYHGSLTTASAWYELGQYEWRGGRTIPGETAAIPDLMTREPAAVRQLPAAICADRVGNTQRAQDLYGWAAGNYLLTEEEIEWFAGSRQIQTIWEFLPMRAYALICVGDWTEALAAAETADFWAKKDRGAQTSEAYQVQLQLLPTLLALARYKLEPAEANRQTARASLALQAIRGRRSMSERLICHFYWYNLRSRFGGELLVEGEDWE